MKDGLHISEEGSKRWYKKGKLHREDGPAVERASGSKFWFINGELHREDGPAVEWASGHKECYLNGKKYTKEEWRREIVNLKFKSDDIDDRDLQLWDDLGLFEGKILDYKSFKNMNKS